MASGISISKVERVQSVVDSSLIDRINNSVKQHREEHKQSTQTTAVTEIDDLDEA